MNGMTGDVAFRDSEMRTVLIVSYSDPQRMTEWTKSQKDVGGLAGLGDAAYWGSAGEDPPSVIGFRQDARAVHLLVAAQGAKTFDRAKLEEVAELISSRMQ